MLQLKFDREAHFKVIFHMFFSSCILPCFLKRKNANMLVVWSMFCSQGFINTRGRITPRKFWPSCFQSRVYAICPFLENGRCGVWQKVKVNFVQTDFSKTSSRLLCILQSSFFSSLYPSRCPLSRAQWGHVFTLTNSFFLLSSPVCMDGSCNFIKDSCWDICRPSLFFG